MPLIASKISCIKPPSGSSRKTVADLNGLYLQVRVTKNGLIRTWIYRKQNLKDRIIFIGNYPEISLAEARRKTLEINTTIEKGGNPWEIHRKEKDTNQDGTPRDCFKNIAEEWFSKTKTNLSEGQKKRIMASLIKDVFPYIGSISVKDIRPKQIIEIARKIEEREVYETCHRTIGRIREVFDFAIINEYCENNPATSIPKVLKPVIHGHFAAITEPIKLRPIIRKIFSYHGVNPIVNILIRLGPLTFQRPSELRMAKWKDIDLDHSEWRYFVTKTKVEHIVPLNRQAVLLLNELKTLTGSGINLFPSSKDKNRFISNNAIRAAYASLEIDTSNEHTEHGWRATARTILDEVLHFPELALEFQLSHSNQKDRNKGAYSRAKYLDVRKQAMQAWGDYIEALATTDTKLDSIARKLKYKP